MKLRVLFKAHRNKSFNYKPRYYDERKEKLEAMKNKYAPKDEASFAGRKRVSFREDWKTERKALNDNNSRIRLIVILLFLLMFAYVALKYVDLGKLL